VHTCPFNHQTEKVIAELKTHPEGVTKHGDDAKLLLSSMYAAFFS
jgi:hypothetical protein